MVVYWHLQTNTRSVKEALTSMCTHFTHTHSHIINLCIQTTQVMCLEAPQICSLDNLHVFTYYMYVCTIMQYSLLAWLSFDKGGLSVSYQLSTLLQYCLEFLLSLLHPDLTGS